MEIGSLPTLTISADTALPIVPNMLPWQVLRNAPCPTSLSDLINTTGNTYTFNLATSPGGSTDPDSRYLHRWWLRGHSDASIMPQLRRSTLLAPPISNRCVTRSTGYTRSGRDRRPN